MALSLKEGPIASHPLEHLCCQTLFHMLWLDGGDIGIEMGLGTGTQASWQGAVSEGVGFAQNRSVTL